MRSSVGPRRQGRRLTCHDLVSRSSLCVFFLWLIAAGCGAIDASAHILHVLSMTLLHIDHHLVEVWAEAWDWAAWKAME